jgi:hypothetical protein
VLCQPSYEADRTDSSFTLAIGMNQSMYMLSVMITSPSFGSIQSGYSGAAVSAAAKSIGFKGSLKKTEKI